MNPYELLDVELETSEADIRKAYRSRSLKVHPDRNPNDPNAAKKFHQLNQAYELLLDPLRRLALDAKLRIQNARKQRFAGSDAKRKAMLEDLEERERLLKKARMDRREEEVNKWTDTERVKEEGKKMMKEREQEIRVREEEAARARTLAEEDDMPPTIGALDTTVRLKYTLTNHPTLTTASSLKSLLSSFGAVDEALIFLSLKPPKKSPDKPAKYATAVVPFIKIGDAFAAVCASGREERRLKGIEVGWAGDKGKEPEIIGWLKKTGKLGAEGTKPASKSASPTADGETGTKANISLSEKRPPESSAYSSFPSSFSNLPTIPPSTPSLSTRPVTAGLDYESLTLMRMRQAERERLEREILEQEAHS